MTATFFFAGGGCSLSVPELRGMSTLLMVYYIYHQEIHRLYDALCRLYEGCLERAIREIKPDGFWTSDDLGHQTQPFVRPSTFREFDFPYYKRIG